MLRILTASSLLALSAAPALAQDVNGPVPQNHMGHANPNAATPATPAIPATPAEPGDDGMETTPAVPATPATPASPSTDATQPTEPTAPAEQRAVIVQNLVDAEFPTYDANKNGNLESAEFGKWVLALYDKSGDANAPKDEAAKAKWSKAAFATADVDKNKNVSKAEMNTFLVG